MESVLTSEKLSSELDFFKRHADTLATLKIKFPPSYVAPPDRRPRKATLANVPVCEPPKLSHDAEASSGPETISLTIKSAKPPLVFTLSAPPTATIATLKALLCEREPTAPSPDSQRWILKGKSLVDGKLLKEYGVEDGAVVNLMVKAPAPGSTPAAAASGSLSTPTDTSAGVPSLTLSSPSPAGTPRGTSPTTSRLPLSIDTSVTAPPAPELTGIAGVVSEPQFWVDAFQLLKTKFGGSEAEAKEVWETWFSGGQKWIEPGRKALIREKVGVSAMGGL
ncbi:hypothetical protein T439DRAFT_291946 [Meredithblackwellia eburnea MCA 4105]